MKAFLFLILCGNIVWIRGLPSGSGNTDPCAGTTCGKGADCRKVSNLVVCICPEDSFGDPFVECRLAKEPDLSTSGTTTTTTSTTGSPPTTKVSELSLSADLKLGTDPPIPVRILDANDSHPKIGPTMETHQNDGAEAASGDPNPSYFPSAPPTLSHYAHSHSFASHLNSGPIQLHTEPPSQYHQQLNQLYSPSRTRTRPANNNIINHEPPNNSGMSSNYGQQQQPGPSYSGHPNGPPPQPHPYPHPNEDFDLHANQHPFYRNSEHRHPANGHYHHVHHNSFLQPHPHPHHYGQTPNFKPEAHGPKPHHDSPVASGGMEKDPLGKYENCRTINNILVCADTSGSENDSHHRRIHAHPSHSISEHRYPANSHGPPYNSFEKKPVQLPPHFPPPMHNNGPINFNEKHAHPGLHEDRPSNHYPRPGPIAAEESTNYGHRPSMSQLNGNKQHDLLSHFSEKSKGPIEPQPGSNEWALCKKLCGEGSVCRVMMGRPVCGCPEGHTGDPAVKCYIEKSTKYDPNSCQRHTDCSTSMVCLKGTCTDPCLLKNTEETQNISSFHYSLDSAGNKGSICGVNAVCVTVEHTPLCSCEQNFFGNPYVGCVI